MSHGLPDGSASRLMPRWEDVHPWLISAVVVASLGARNVKWVTLWDVLVVVGLAWLAVTTVFLGLLLLRRSARHAALVASWASLLAFYYGVAFEELSKLPMAGSNAVCHGLLLTIGFGLSAIIWWFKGDLRRLSAFVSLTAAIALAVFSLSFGQALMREPRPQRTDMASKLPPRVEIASQDESHPDVYYIILDGYGRDDVLRKYYDFDNSEFLDGLRTRGFYVAEKSCTNYPATAFSLPSSLNMKYHEPIDRRTGLKPLAEMVRTNEVGLRLRERGYKLIHFNTRFIATAYSNIADVSLGEQTMLPAGSRMMMLHLIDHGALRFFNGGERGLFAAQHRRALTELSDVPAIAGPKLTFLHLVAPHPPFVFNRAGRTDWNIDQNSRTSYIDQLAYLNREVTRAIDNILAKSVVPPVIIIQSDHGAGFCKAKGDSPDPTAEYVQERVPILNAYLVPEAMRNKLYPTITPVNSFRLLLTECFGFDYPLVPDRSFMFHQGSWATFAEITDRIHDGTPQQGMGMPTPDQAPDQLAENGQTTRVE